MKSKYKVQNNELKSKQYDISKHKQKDKIFLNK